MSNILHIFNYETTFDLPNSKVILVDKREPDKALLKIPAEFATLFKQGFFRGHGLEINYNGIQAWLSRDAFGQIQRKRPKIKLSDIGMSFREFHMNSAVEGKAKAFARICRHVRFDISSVNHVMFITEQPLTHEHGEFAKYLKHYLGEVLQNVDAKVQIHVVSTAGRNLSGKIGDDVTVKALAVAEHFIGFKIRKNKVTPVELDTNFDLVNYYDNDDDYVQAITNIKLVLDSLAYSDEELRTEVQREAFDKRSIWAHYVTSNDVNPLKSIQASIK